VDPSPPPGGTASPTPDPTSTPTTVDAPSESPIVPGDDPADLDPADADS
jgi:hypothetical protein